MRVYLSGPMRGLPDLNAPAFERAAAAWRAEGYEVVNPHELDAADGFTTFEAAIARDICCILDCDILAVLPGWQKSVGARIEVIVAKAIGLPIVQEDKPWWPMHKSWLEWRNLLK